MTVQPNVGAIAAPHPRRHEAAQFDKDMLNWYHYEQSIPMRTAIAMMLNKSKTDLWRLHFELNGMVDLLFIGMSTDEKKEHRVPADGLPEWMKDRIAVLNTFGPNWPTDYIEGVGRRISERTYYVEE